MKKQRTKLLPIIIVAIAVVVLAVKLKDPISTLLETPIPTPATTSEVQSNDHERNMYLMEDFGIACGFKYTVKDVYLTHKRGEWGEDDSIKTKNENYQRRFQTDEVFLNESGDFINNYFYMVVTLEIQNLTDQLAQVNTLDNSIIPIMGNVIGTVDDMPYECCDVIPIPKENPNFEKYKDLFWNPDAPPRLIDTYYTWILEPDESVVIEIPYFPLSDKTLKKVLDGEWTLSIRPAPMGTLGKAYSGPGKLGQEDQIDPEILKEENFLSIDGVRSTYIELPITEDCIRD